MRCIELRCTGRRCQNRLCEVLQFRTAGKIRLMKVWPHPRVRTEEKMLVDFVKNIQAKVNSQEGNTLPVSAFNDYVDGTTPSVPPAYEKRGIAVNVPYGNAENCIQCNQCSYVCPHAVIRPVAMTEREAASVPEGTQIMPT